MRLIDADALKFTVHVHGPIAGRGNPVLDALMVVQRKINNAPTIDAVPVVHSEWIEDGRVWVHSMDDVFEHCKNCREKRRRGEFEKKWLFCPQCGAKMDGGAEG